MDYKFVTHSGHIMLQLRRIMERMKNLQDLVPNYGEGLLFVSVFLLLKNTLTFFDHHQCSHGKQRKNKKSKVFGHLENCINTCLTGNLAKPSNTCSLAYSGDFSFSVGLNVSVQPLTTPGHGLGSYRPYDSFTECFSTYFP